MSPTPEFAHDHDVRLYQGAQELFPALVEAMDAALSDIQFETYIFDFTGAGSSVGEALARAAQRGVRTHLVVDGVGTGRLPALWAARLTAAGVQWRVYSPLGRLGLLLPSRWRRLHRKLCVVDGRVLFCGGINVLDDFYDPNHGALDAPRFDFAVRATGSLVVQASDAMEQLWWRMQAVRDVRKRRLPEALQALRTASAQRHAEQQIGQLRGSGAKVRAALVLRDNVRNRARIEKTYLRAIGSARQEVIIANAYFVPGRKLRKALLMAARRGVRVRLLLQGRYEYFMQYHAARPVYGPAAGPRSQRGGGRRRLCPRPAPAPGARHAARRPPHGPRPLRRPPPAPARARPAGLWPDAAGFVDHRQPILSSSRIRMLLI